MLLASYKYNLLVLFTAIPPLAAYCWQPGLNPGWKRAPTVTTSAPKRGALSTGDFTTETGGDESRKNMPSGDTFPTYTPTGDTLATGTPTGETLATDTPTEDTLATDTPTGETLGTDTSTVVRVSWDGAVTMLECVDNFLVKYWKKNDPGQWK